MRKYVIEVIDEFGHHCYLTQSTNDVTRNTNLSDASTVRDAGRFDIRQVATILPALAYELVAVLTAK